MISKPTCLGKKIDTDGSKGRPRLLIAKVDDFNMKKQILGKAKELKVDRNSIWKKVYITPDLTFKEREANRKLRGHIWIHFAHRLLVYCYLEFKLRYLKNLKLFSIKDLFEPIVLRKRRRRVFALFKSIFLRNRSLSNARWFCGRKRKIGKGNLSLTENRLSINEMWYAEDDHNNMYHICEKEL